LYVGSANPLFSTEDAIEANRFMKAIEAVARDSSSVMYVTSFSL
jgi:GPI-anchor transamidase subunit GAA1